MRFLVDVTEIPAKSKKFKRAFKLTPRAADTLIHMRAQRLITCRYEDPAAIIEGYAAQLFGRSEFKITTTEKSLVISFTKPAIAHKYFESFVSFMEWCNTPCLHTKEHSKKKT